MNLPALTQLLARDNGVPPHDTVGFTYVNGGATNDDLIATMIYYRGGVEGTVVATVYFSYVGETNNIAAYYLEVTDL